MDRRSLTAFYFKIRNVEFSHPYRWIASIILLVILQLGFSKTIKLQEKPCSGQAGYIHSNGGGFVANSVQITGDPTIDETSEVCDFVTIKGSSVMITEGSKIKGRAYLTGHVEVSNSIVEGNAFVDGRDGDIGVNIHTQSRVYGNAKVLDDVEVNNSQIYGQASARDQAEVETSQVYGQARLLEKSTIFHSKIHGKVQVSGSGVIRSTGLLTEVCDDVVIGGTTIIENTTKLCKSIPVTPRLSIFPKTKIFTNTPVSGISEEVFFTIKNEGSVDASGCSSLQFTGDTAEFQITQNTCNNSVMVGEGGSCLLKLRGKPNLIGNKKLTIVRSCSIGGIVKTEQDGISYLAVASTQMALSPLQAELPTTALGTSGSASQKFVFQNTGTQMLTECDQVKIEGDDSDQFSIVKNSCGTNNLPPLSGSNSFFDFDNAALFVTSDGSKIEILDGVARLKKSSATANTTFYASYDQSINGDVGNGNLVGTATGPVSVSNGALNLNASDIRYVDYDALGKGNFQKVVTLRFRYIPNYQGSPATTQSIFTVFETTASNLNRLQFQHANTGALSLLAWDTAGAATVSYSFGNYAATNGEEVELELNIDFINGESRLFINGTQFGPTLTTQLNRIGNNITKMRLGSTRNASNTANFSIGQFAVFNTVQHTNNYQITNEWLLYSKDHPYLEMAAAYPFSSALKNFEAITSGGSGDQVRFLVSIDNGLNWKYWNGTFWSNSNQSFLEATTAALINSKISLLGPNGLFKFRAILHSATGETTPKLDEVTFGNLVGACEVRLAATPVSSGQKRATLSRKCQSTGEVKSIANGITYSAIAPILNATPFNHHYGSYSLGMPAGSKVFTFRNDTSAIAQYCSPATILGANPEDFQITTDSCGTNSLNPGQSCNVVVSASPQDIGTRSATLVRNCAQGGLTSTAINGLTVFGQDLNPVLSVVPGLVSFGDILMGNTSASTVVTFNNIGGSDTTGCQPPVLTGAHPSEFVIVSDSCNGIDLPAGIGQCSVVVRAKPTGLDLRTANLDLSCSNGGIISSILEVNSVVPGPTPNLLLSPLAFNFGAIPNGQISTSKIFTIDNLGSGAAIKCSKPYLTGADYSHFQIVNDQCAENNLPAGAICNVEIAALPNKVGLIKSTLNRTCIVGGTVRTMTNAIVAQSLLVEPVLAISPTPLNLGIVAVGGSSSQVFTLSNSGLGNATLCSAPVIQGDTSDFSISNDNCGINSLPSLGTCTVKLNFNPLSSGNKNLTLKRNCTNGGEVVANITAQAIAPLLAMAPTSHNFGNINVGQSSSVRTFTITNNGSGDALGCGSPIVTGADSAHFTLNNTICPGGIISANGGTCSVDVSFNPLFRLAKNAQLEFACTTGGNLSASLTGFGIAPQLAIAPLAHSFGNIEVGQSSAPKAFMITNSGEVNASGCSLPIITGPDSANFSLNILSCPASSVAAGGGTCNVEVSFAPLSIATKNAMLERVCTVGGTVSASLSGSGNGPQLAVTPSTHNFGNIDLGQTSTSQSFVITNSGNQNASGCSAPVISGVDAAHFVLDSTTCSSGSISAGGGSCAINVNFAPTTRSIKNATVELSCSIGGNITATLSGKGIGPQLAITPTSHSFGNTVVGQLSAAQTFTISNSGDGNASGCVNPVLVGVNSSEFSLNNVNCSGSTLTPGGSCDVEVKFSPLSNLAKNSNLQFSCASGGMVSAALSGVGVGPSLTTNPHPINFGAIQNGNTSAPMNIVFTNTGSAGASGCGPFTLDGGNASEFEIVSGSESCGSTLPLAGNCSLNLKAVPISLGAKTTTLKKVCSVGGTLTAAVSALSAQPILSIQPLNYNFGDVALGGYSGYQDFTIENNGLVSATGCNPLALSGINSTEFNILNSNACGSTINSGESCIAKVRAHPADIGLISASLNLSCSNNATLSSSLVASGTTLLAKMAITPIKNDFGNVVINTASKSITFTIVNDSEGKANNCQAPIIEGIDAPQFAIESNTCLNYMDRKGNCQVTISATPGSVGIKKANLKRVCTLGGVARADLTALGINGNNSLAFNKSSLDFGTIPKDQLSSDSVISLINQGEGKALNCSPPILSGSHANQFMIRQDGCGSDSLNSKTSCQITVVAAPTSVGSKQAILTRTCSAGGSATVNLSALVNGSATALIASRTKVDFGQVKNINSSKVETITFINQSKTKVINCFPPHLSGTNANQFVILSNTCQFSEIASGNSCAVSVYAAPNSLGNKNASLDFTCGFGGALNISLSASVTAGVAQVKPDQATYDFSNVITSQASKARLIRWTNQGPGPVTGCSAVALSGTNANEFKIESSNCNTSLDGTNDNCSTYISATPLTVGSKAASLVLSCNVGGNAIVSLRANGISGPSSLAMIEKSFDFGLGRINQASKAHNFTLRNSGAGSASSCSAPTIVGTNASQFSIVEDNCGTQNLLSQQGCNIQVVANPSSNGIKKAKLTRACAVGGVASSDLIVTGSPGEQTLKFNLAQVDYLTIPVGQSSNERIITLINNGDGPALNCQTPILSSGNSNDFIIVNDDCRTDNLLPGKSCQIRVEARPKTLGVKVSNLNRTCAVGGSAVASLQVRAVDASSALSATPLDFNFLNVPAGQASPVNYFVVTNISQGKAQNCTTTIEGTNPSDFSLSPLGVNSCTTSLASASTCNISLDFAPLSSGEKTAVLKHRCEIGGEISINLQGRGTPAVNRLSLNPSGMNFTNVEVGTQSREKLFIVRNNTEGFIRGCSDPVISGSHANDFIINYQNLTKPCVSISRLAKGDYCQILVAAAPMGSIGDKIANLNFSCSVGGITSASLFARGIQSGSPELSVWPTLLSFDPFQKKELSLVIKNTGNQDALDCQFPQLVGANKNAFKLLSHTCSDSTLRAGESCKVTITPNGAIASIGSHSVYVRRKCEYGGEILSIARTNSSRTGAGIDYLPIKMIDHNSDQQSCSLFDNGQVFCLGKESKGNFSELRMQTKEYFLKDFYLKGKSNCVKSIKNQETCRESL